MRKVLFRGKRACVYENPWVEGGFHSRDGHAYIIGISKTQRIDGCEVIPETVGQYTGLEDRNGKRIFEGDIIQGLFLHSHPVNSLVIFRDGAFGLLWNRAGAETYWSFTSICNVEYEVIGNIYDNPELLESGADMRGKEE